MENQESTGSDRWDDYFLRLAVEAARMSKDPNTRVGPITGASLARESGCKATAMNNRLAVLERLGYASSERHGRERRFRAIVKKGGQS